MTYATKETVQLAAGGSERFRQLAGDDDELITSAIVEAIGWVEKAIGKRYAVPLVDPVDPDVAAMVANESVFIIARRKGMTTEDDREAHVEREKRLDAYATGKLTLSGGVLKPAKSSLVVDNASPRPDDKQVSREKTKGFW